MKLYDDLCAIIDVLNEGKIDYAICGALALAIHEGLISMKKMAGRLQDLADIERLAGRSEGEAAGE